MTPRKALLESLEVQLAEIGADVTHFRDLLSDYADLADVKNKLIRDIKQRGVVYTEVSQNGVETQKNNPSVRDLTAVNRQMLVILRELGIKTDKTGTGSGEDIDL